MAKSKTQTVALGKKAKKGALYKALGGAESGKGKSALAGKSFAGKK